MRASPRGLASSTRSRRSEPRLRAGAGHESRVDERRDPSGDDRSRFVKRYASTCRTWHMRSTGRIVCPGPTRIRAPRSPRRMGRLATRRRTAGSVVGPGARRVGSSGPATPAPPDRRAVPRRDRRRAHRRERVRLLRAGRGRARRGPGRGACARGRGRRWERIPRASIAASSEPSAPPAIPCSPASWGRLVDCLPTRTFELVVHGIDLARATGRDPEPPAGALSEVSALAARRGAAPPGGAHGARSGFNVLG